MSRSLGSDGIRRYCDAAVALTIVFATVIAMVAAVIVASNALNFSVATIAFVLTCPIPLFACSAADANQLQAPIAARQSGTLSSNITIEPERSLNKPLSCGGFLLTHVDGVSRLESSRGGNS